MFDKLIQLLLEFWNDLKPFVVIEHFNSGVILRFGKGHRMTGPGFHWKWPFAETSTTTTVVPTTMDLKPQTVMTKDGHIVTVRGMVKSQVDDVWRFLLEVYDTPDAVGDTTMGVIARLIMDSTFEEIKGTDINNEISKKSRAQAKNYGVNIIQVTLVDISPSRSFRIYNESGLYG
jgi:regulator of protease activity HflC (stomatin/prohibitin superfamily)